MTRARQQQEKGDDEEEEQWPVIWCYDGWHPLRERLERILPSWAALRVMDTSRPLCEQCQDAKVLIPTTGAVDAAAIEAAAGLRLIAQPAAGYSNIDVAAAKRRGVPVTIAPGSNRHSTAEAALMLILMLARRSDDVRAAFRRRVIGDPVGTELHGKTLGVVGMGQVGSCLAAAARGLGMYVIGVGSKSPREDFESLLRASDVVSLHVHSTPQTRGLIGACELALMRPHALLVNTARGDVVDDAALLAALKEGWLGGVGLDVHTVEPADPDSELYRHPKVLALPHCGSATEEVYQRQAELLRDNIVASREGGGALRHRLC